MYFSDLEIKSYFDENFHTDVVRKYTVLVHLHRRSTPIHRSTIVSHKVHYKTLLITRGLPSNVSSVAVSELISALVTKGDKSRYNGFARKLGFKPSIFIKVFDPEPSFR